MGKFARRPSPHHRPVRRLNRPRGRMLSVGEQRLSYDKRHISCRRMKECIRLKARRTASRGVDCRGPVRPPSLFTATTSELGASRIREELSEQLDLHAANAMAQVHEPFDTCMPVYRQLGCRAHPLNHSIGLAEQGVPICLYGIQESRFAYTLQRLRDAGYSH